MKYETTFRCADAGIRTQVVVICGRTRYQLDHRGAHNLKEEITREDTLETNREDTDNEYFLVPQRYILKCRLLCDGILLNSIFERAIYWGTYQQMTKLCEDDQHISDINTFCSVSSTSELSNIHEYILLKWRKKTHTHNFRNNGKLWTVMSFYISDNFLRDLTDSNCAVYFVYIKFISRTTKSDKSENGYSSRVNNTDGFLHFLSSQFLLVIYCCNNNNNDLLLWLSFSQSTPYKPKRHHWMVFYPVVQPNRPSVTWT